MSKAYKIWLLNTDKIEYRLYVNTAKTSHTATAMTKISTCSRQFRRSFDRHSLQAVAYRLRATAPLFAFTACMYTHRPTHKKGACKHLFVGPFNTYIAGQQKTEAHQTHNRQAHRGNAGRKFPFRGGKGGGETVSQRGTTKAYGGKFGGGGEGDSIFKTSPWFSSRDTFFLFIYISLEEISRQSSKLNLKNFFCRKP